jgi:D-alanine transaminase
MLAYLNGKFLEKSQMAISPDDRGFLFADGVYEVIRAYAGRFFRWDAHMQRLAKGLRELRIAPPDLGELETAARHLLLEKKLAEATVYIQITRGSAPRSHPFPPEGTRPTVYVDAQPFSPKRNLQEQGVTAILVPDQRWARCDIKTTGLLPNVLASQRASEAGAYEALLVRDGAILEGSRTNVFVVKDDTLMTPPLTNYILPGITRQAVLELAERLRIKTQLGVCFEEQLSDCQEVFLSGTTSEVTPVVRIGSREVGKGKPGPVTCRLQRALREAVAA